MLSKLYKDEFVYKGIDDVNGVYDLAILPEINGNVVVVITALGEDAKISITSYYERIAKQVYFRHLQETEINKIIWIERIIHQTSEEAFFEVDLIWDEKLEFFHSPQWEPCDPKIIKSIKTLCEEYVG